MSEVASGMGSISLHLQEARYRSPRFGELLVRDESRTKRVRDSSRWRHRWHQPSTCLFPRLTSTPNRPGCMKRRQLPLRRGTMPSLATRQGWLSGLPSRRHSRNIWRLSLAKPGQPIWAEGWCCESVPPHPLFGEELPPHRFHTGVASSFLAR